MEMSLVYLRPKPVLFVRASGSYRRSSKRAWTILLAWLEGQDPRWRSASGYGIVNDDPHRVSAPSRRYDACIDMLPGLEIDPAIGIGRRMTPGGPYAIVRCQGPYDRLGAAFSQLHRACTADRALRVEPGRALVEIYRNNPANTPADALLTDACMPVCVGAAAGLLPYIDWVHPMDRATDALGHELSNHS